MKQIQRLTSSYSADLFGICSTLYELGGLVVMHDSSGCNSTYATHDEPRWFEMDSMIYISALEEYDAVLGNEEKLISDILECALERHPRFIAVCGSPIAFIMGTDFKGLARVLEKRSGIPSFGFKTSGMYSYQQGSRQAFQAIAERFCPSDPSLSVQREKRMTARAEGTLTAPIRINLLGVTPLDFSIGKNITSLHNFVRESGFEEISCWAMGDTLDSISRAGQADVNLVVSSTAIDAAETLKERFGTPYVAGIPMGNAACQALRRKITSSAIDGQNRTISGSQLSLEPRNSPWNLMSPRKHKKGKHLTGLIEPEMKKNDGLFIGKNILLIGEPLHTESFRYCLEQESGADVKTICPLEDTFGLQRAGDLHTDEERTIEREINNADIVFADPIYKRLLDAESDTVFISFPQENYSGRMFREEIPTFVGAEFSEFIHRELTVSCKP